jgi:hypothetical protein
VALARAGISLLGSNWNWGDGPLNRVTAREGDVEWFRHNGVPFMGRIPPTSTALNGPGFTFQSERVATTSAFTLVVHYWAAALLFALLPAIRLWRHGRRGERSRPD